MKKRIIAVLGSVLIFIGILAGCTSMPDSEQRTYKVTFVQLGQSNVIKEVKARLEAVEDDLTSTEIDEELKASLEAKKAKLEEDLKYYTETPVQTYTYKNIPKTVIAEKVKWAAGVLGVEDLLDSKPKV